MKIRLLIFAIATAVLYSPQRALSEMSEISFSSLLKEMTDRDTLARLPKIPYTCKQFSSFDRNADTPGSSTWWANEDRSYFIRVEENHGRKEHVMMDTEGPGAIVRIWATWVGPNDTLFSNGILRVYLDDYDKPVIEGPTEEVIDKGFLAGPPLSQSVAPATEYRWSGHNLYLPIPYAEKCKITYETDVLIDEGAFKGEGFYYQINYRTYDKSANVKTFSMRDLKTSKSLLTHTQKILARSERTNLENVNEKFLEDIINPEESKSIKLKGPAAIRAIDLKLKAEDIEQALRSTVLEIKFDNRQTVWCPAGDFFGIGHRLIPYATWYTEVSVDGTMSCYWIMPFQDSAEIIVHNLSKNPVSVENMTIHSSSWDWDENSVYFYSTWKQWAKIRTQSNAKALNCGALDLNWVTITGTGHYVGDSLTLFNGGNTWWGEGDEKIYVDGESFPSHFGTGSEDYYGYAFGRPEFFAAPFHAQPIGSGNFEVGITVNSRYRALDAIPFSKSLKFDMELWHWAATGMNYAPATFWYARPGAQCDVQPMPDEARRKIPRVREDVIETRIVKGAVEGETLKVKDKTGGTIEIQESSQDNWSSNKQLWWKEASIDDKLMLEIPIEKAGTYTITAGLTKANDYAVVDIKLNGQKLTKDLDLYNTSVKAFEVELGKCVLESGSNILEITIVGANLKAVKKYMFGLDYLVVKK